MEQLLKAFKNYYFKGIGFNYELVKPYINLNYDWYYREVCFAEISLKRKLNPIRFLTSCDDTEETFSEKYKDSVIIEVDREYLLNRGFVSMDYLFNILSGYFSEDELRFYISECELFVF